MNKKDQVDWNGIIFGSCILLIIGFFIGVFAVQSNMITKVPENLNIVVVGDDGAVLHLKAPEVEGHKYEFLAFSCKESLETISKRGDLKIEQFKTIYGAICNGKE